MAAFEHIFGDPQGRNATVAWEPEPQGRGTLSILWTCLLTISLCVWTALHLNIPPPEDEGRTKLRKIVRMFYTIKCYFKQEKAPGLDSVEVLESARTARAFLRKVIWLLLGMFTPEVVVYAAASQFLEARNFAKSELSATQRFFVTMGGVAIDPKEWSQDYLPPYFHGTLVYLSREQLVTVNLYDSSLVMQIPDRIIQDKSKTSTLAQTIVCTQALWFMAQCISRFAQPLPITLLELNTFAHCLCALMVYVLWWHKPLDVVEPIILRGDSAHQLLAFFLTLDFDTDYRMGRMEFRECGAIEGVATQAVSHNDISPSSRGDILLNPGDQLLNTRVYNNEQKNENVLVDQNGIERWALAAPVFDLLKRKGRTPPEETDILTKPRSDISRKALAYDETNDRLVAPILLASGIIYGGLHALAWNAPFRNSIERHLWRASSIIIMSYGPVYYLLATVVFARGGMTGQGRMLFDIWRRLGLVFKLLPQPQKLASAFHGRSLRFYSDFFIESVLNLAFLFARIYLVWESFWSLFHAVPGVFLTPKWSDFFPHIG